MTLVKTHFAGNSEEWETKVKKPREKKSANTDTADSKAKRSASKTDRGSNAPMIDNFSQWSLIELFEYLVTLGLGRDFELELLGPKKLNKPTTFDLGNGAEVWIPRSPIWTVAYYMKYGL